MAAPTARYVHGKPIMQKYTAGSAVAAGDVVRVGSIPAVAHVDIPSFTGGPTLDALAIGGGVYVIATDGTPVLGEDVYYNTSSKKLTATSVGNLHFGTLVAGPTGDMSAAGPAADGDLGYAYHEPLGTSAGTAIGTRSEATQTTTASLTAAQVLGGMINSAPAGAVTLTTPTAALLVAGIPGAAVGDSFDVTIENTSGGANTITLAGGTGCTFRGGTSVAQDKSALLRFLLTNVGNGTEAYTVHSVVGA